MKYSDNIIRIITYCVVAAIVLLFAARPNGILKPFGLFVRDILGGIVPDRAGYATAGYWGESLVHKVKKGVTTGSKAVVSGVNTGVGGVTKGYDAVVSGVDKGLDKAEQGLDKAEQGTAWAVDFAKKLPQGIADTIHNLNAAFKTNKDKNLDYRLPAILDIASGKGTYKNYIPQGFSMTKNYIYFSAYHKWKSCAGCDSSKAVDKGCDGYQQTARSKVFKIKRSTGTLVKVYNLKDQKIGSHVGGLAVIEDTNQFFVAGEKTNGGTGDGSLVKYDMDDADQNPNLQVDVSISNTDQQYGSNTFDLGGGAISFMQWDKSRSLLWMGTWEKTSHSNYCAVRVEINSNDADLGDVIFIQHVLPVDSVQGIAVYPNSNDKDAKNPTIYLSKSYGYQSEDPPYIVLTSQIWKWVPTYGQTGDTAGDLYLVAEGFPGLENMDFDPKWPNKLWGISEAGSRYYQTRTMHCGGPPPWPHHPGYIYAEIDVGLPSSIGSWMKHFGGI